MGNPVLTSVPCGQAVENCRFTLKTSESNSPLASRQQPASWPEERASRNLARICTDKSACVNRCQTLLDNEQTRNCRFDWSLTVPLSSRQPNVQGQLPAFTGYVKKKYGQAWKFRRIYAARFITSGLSITGVHLGVSYDLEHLFSLQSVTFDNPGSGPEV